MISIKQRSRCGKSWTKWFADYRLLWRGAWIIPVAEFWIK